jgi:uncharacterized protein DUF3971
MTDKYSSSHSAALQELEAALLAHRRMAADSGAAARSEDAVPARRRWGLRPDGWRLPFNPWFPFDRRHPVMRKLTLVLIAAAVVVVIGGAALWWRLSSGPIMLDLATPWLTAAIEQNLGSRYRVEVGGTQLERDEQGHTALRLRDIVLRDASGAPVAVAPKAEVGISGASLLFARPRARSIRLVDADMTIRIDPDGRLNVLVGSDRPILTSAAVGSVPPVPLRGTPTTQPRTDPPASSADPAASSKQLPADFSLQTLAERGIATNFAALLSWIDRLGSLELGGDTDTGGFDGHALTEIGITNGSLTINDRRNGQDWQFKQISLRLTRQNNGGAVFTVLSESQERPWVVNTALTPLQRGHRRLQLEARQVVLDDLLALRMSETRVRSDTRVSASIDSEFTADGTPQSVTGSIIAQGGSFGSPDDPTHLIPIGGVEIGLDWDNARRTLRVPFKVTAGTARYALRSEFVAPAQPGDNWLFAVGGGWIILDPPAPNEEGLILKRVVVRGSIDPERQRITLDQGDIGTKELGSLDDKDVKVALSGYLDYGQEPRLAVGIAGSQMSVGALKRLWPVFVASKVRDWVLQHIISGTVERLDIATNAPLATFPASGPPIPEEGLAVEIVGNGVMLRPVEGLPAIRDADLNMRVTGRTAVVTLGKGSVEVSQGRRLAISNGVFEVPDTRPVAPPARVRLRLEGSVPAAAELLALDRLREFSGAPFDPSVTRGSLSAQINLAMPLRPDLPKGSTEYNIAVDLSNFSAEKMLFGQKVEGQTLRANASNQRYEIKGEVKIGGAPAEIEYSKLATEPDAEVKVTATLDDTARARLGLDLGPTVVGALPMRVTGRVGANDRDAKFNIEANLTPLKIENLLPGWVKPAGRPARAAFTMVKDKSGFRFDDVLVDGQGVLAKGTVEIDGSGDVVAANFPVFATSDGDKVMLKADRGADGALRVVMRGDVYDGRNFVKLAMGGPNDPKIKPRHPDLDIDIKLGVVAGHNGEALRGLELRLSRRGGRVRTFSLNSKIGRDTPFIGDMRTRLTNGRPVMYFETSDAGALFRFTDLYSRMIGGKMWMGMDPPSQDTSPQDGLINVRDFTIRGEAALDRVASGAQDASYQQSNAIDFSQARADFIRTPGRMTIRDGVLRGPMIGATMEGNIDYARDQVHVRGTLVPLYGLNNMFGQIPIVGMFLGGGSNEGIFGITYEVSGPTGNPRPLVNPISAIAPGILRKFFEFRDLNQERTFAEPMNR